MHPDRAQAGPTGVDPQHAEPSPRPPRQEPLLHRQELRRCLHHLGQTLRSVVRLCCLPQIKWNLIVMNGYFLNLKGEKAIVLFYFTCVSDDVMLLCCSGTFAEEKDDEEISYGLVFPVNSWDLVYIQVAVTQNQDIFLTYMYVLVLYISTTCTLVCIVSISCFLP